MRKVEFMPTYTCSLGLNATGNAVVTSWSVDTPSTKELFIGDTVSFTSSIGDWRVDFANSPFNPTDTPSTFSAPVGQTRSAQLVRGGGIKYVFDCILTVNGQTIGYIEQGQGDDIRVKP
jgi:hypothetical protein